MIFLSCATGSQRVVVILKLAVIIKDLYGNSVNRFKKINTRWDFQ